MLGAVEKGNRDGLLSRIDFGNAYIMGRRLNQGLYI